MPPDRVAVRSGTGRLQSTRCYTASEPRDRLVSVTVPMALPARYQQMAFADELLDRPVALQNAYERDGYLFFRGMLHRALPNESESVRLSADPWVSVGTAWIRHA